MITVGELRKQLKLLPSHYPCFALTYLDKTAEEIEKVTLAISDGSKTVKEIILSK